MESFQEIFRYLGYLLNILIIFCTIYSQYQDISI